ncbi:uncharacterized protein LOC115633808 [Scaptodrosophila lebanonensis]|uniref:Uncharacterized protein LOC115633808 n=1 Tax=Drosophila lebanonensis TaxID=7225 RepID=A0A6J2UI38_DROLE|nr:uncharacterized protein LOC115633808 [Scaptodrosophila lebanonensis]
MNDNDNFRSLVQLTLSCSAVFKQNKLYTMPNKVLLVLLLSLSASNTNAELSGLFNILQYFGIYSAVQPEELGQSRGQCHYSFTRHVLQLEQHTCLPDDKHILHLLQERRQPVRKPPIMVKCLQPEPLDNVTYASTKLLVVENSKDIVNLLKPIGNATKRHEHGSCVIVHFCTASSLGCAKVAPVINLLPYLFPMLRIAYIDAYEFPGFNAEFGIVGLPTLMIFHQGRPIVKYQSEERSYSKFITRHTNIKPIDSKTIHPLIRSLTRDSAFPLSKVPAVQTDYYLGMAWAFILVCLVNYLRRTLLWKQLVEMVQRNWRESEETQMEMVD